jgi:hypothetical protein
MSHATLALPDTHHAAGYARNVGTAARALIAALCAVPAAAPAAAPVAASKDISLYRLYQLAKVSSQFDSVSPALVKELQQFAAH